MLSQQLKAALITAVAVLAVAAVFIYMGLFFAAKQNDQTLTQNFKEGIETVKGGDTDVEDTNDTQKEIEQKTQSDTTIRTNTQTNTDTEKNTNTHTTTERTITNIPKEAQDDNIELLFDTISIFNDVNTTNVSSGEVLAYNGDQWVPATAGQNTDNQLLSIDGDNLTIERGNTIKLTTNEYRAGNGMKLKNDEEFEINAPTCGGTDKLSWNGNAFICSPDEGTAITAGTGIDITGDTISLANTAVTAGTYGNTTTVPQITIDQQGRITNVQSITITDNDTLNSLNCVNNQIAKYNGTIWVCATDDGGVGSSTFIGLTDTPNTFTSNQIVAVNASGTALEYTNKTVNTDNQNLTSASINASNILTITIEDGSSVNVDLTNLINDADFNPTNEIQDLNLLGNNLTITNNIGATTINLTPYLDNTDNQQIDVFTLAADVLTLEMQNDGQPAQTVSLSAYMDNTDAQAISRIGNTIVITGNASTVDLTPYINTDSQTLALNTNNLSISNGNQISLLAYLDNTDNQVADIFNIQSNILHLSLEDDAQSVRLYS